VRDGIGFIGDYALAPVNWGIFWHNPPAWTNIPPGVNTLRALPRELKHYDAATEDAVDPYLALRSAYIQNRAEAARK
jgi:ABC-type transporter lipoprotein component MlaA